MKALIFVVLLSGCANIKGVVISEGERHACEMQGCTVWTESELTGVARKFWREGYQAGVKSI